MNRFEHEKLENLASELESTKGLNNEELKQLLIERGLDPEGTLNTVEEMVHGFLKSKRLSWQEAARQKKKALEIAAGRIVSWASRKPEEIEEAFAKIRAGVLGEGSRGRLQTAFRNLEVITIEDKASFLDELETLKELDGGDEIREKE